MPVCNVGTAEALCGVTAQELESHDISCSNVIGYASDTGVML